MLTTFPKSGNSLKSKAGVTGSSRRKAQTRSAFSFIELFVVIAILAMLVLFLLPGFRRGSGGYSRRMVCKNNLKQIGIALHYYAEEYGSYPPAYTVDAQGKPLHSWRTLILPFLDQQRLYEKIDLTKPWNHPANAEAYKADLHVYRCPSVELPLNRTAYLALVSPDGVFRPSGSRQLSEITDKHHETLQVVEVPADQSVHWMAPLDADLEKVFGQGPEAKTNHVGGASVLFVNGSVKHIRSTITTDQIRAMISVAGNDEVDDDALY